VKRFIDTNINIDIYTYEIIDAYYAVGNPAGFSGGNPAGIYWNHKFDN